MDLPQAGATADIDSDVPCAACGYDLRGLHSAGRCPECGSGIAESLEAYHLAMLRRPEPLVSADRRWVQALAEGATISLVTLTLLIILAAAPDWAFAWKTEARKVMLYIACAAWVLGAYAVWKLTIREPQEEVLRGEVRLGLRICAIAYGLLPFLIGLEKHLHEYLRPTHGIIGLLGGLLGSCLYYLYLGRLARRCSERWITGPAYLAAGLNFGVFVFVSFIQPTLRSEYGPLAIICGLPTLQHGSAGFARLCLVELSRGDILPSSVLVSYAVVALLLAYVNIGMCLALWNAVRQHTPSPAGKVAVAAGQVCLREDWKTALAAGQDQFAADRGAKERPGESNAVEYSHRTEERPHGRHPGAR